MRRSCGPRAGVTLIELVVTMMILGIVAGVAALAIRRVDPPNPNDPRQVLADTLRAVVASGQSARVRVRIGDTLATATVRPDGSIIADSAFGIDRLTGAPNAR